ncbi:glutathione hydrolase 1 proenzyme [Nomia melanderi]|uniref:glutathione hydrolase 1 proenzyme n=1 Tax=Nomia melanderi TaxID=2448451 RepID=UPI0013042500|nr:glutathione hydrolase 1 proenzyme-like [Nomia melanderi]
MIGLKKKVLIGGVLAVILVGVIIALLVVFLVNNSESETGKNFRAFAQAAVSTNGQECAQIGANVLFRDGSAVDAAIAALLCEGVASLHSMGLGGGFLMTIWDARNKTARFLDARETAPAKAKENMFERNSSASMYGGLAIAVPGELLGYWEAHQRYGKLPWSELFEPTISLCETGSFVNDYLARYLVSKESLIRAESSLAEILINPDTDSPWKAGDRIKRPRLAETLRLIAKHGPQIFYNGTMGEKLVEEIKAAKGIVEMQDLRDYRVKWKKPIESRIGNLTIISAPPPGSGVILTFIMNVLRGLLPVNDQRIMWQRFVETLKWAYARRTELGDPDFVDGVDSLVDTLNSVQYADEIRGKIKDDRTSNDPRHYGVFMVPEDSGTSHVSVLAPDGSAVSVTSTINQVFGAMLRSKSTGIIFNDEMDDFSSPNMTNGFDLPPSPANYIRPGKRPMSSMSPTIIVDHNKNVRLVIGAAGGSKITSAVAGAMVLNLWSEYNIKEAVDEHRIHHQLLPMVVQNEAGFPSNVLNYLSSIGHNVTAFTGIGSAITAVSHQHGHVFGVSDFRRQGRTAGF